MTDKQNSPMKLFMIGFNVALGVLAAIQLVAMGIAVSFLFFRSVF